ncbi:MAG: hypothetical protein ACM3W4_02615 [Ignavibacteriales bacterium]
MDPRRDTETLKATDVDDDDELEFEDENELDDYEDDDEVDEDEDLDDEDDEEAELSQAELDDRGGRDTERELDHGLKETFPASDPVSINPGAD